MRQFINYFSLNVMIATFYMCWNFAGVSKMKPQHNNRFAKMKQCISYWEIL